MKDVLKHMYKMLFQSYIAVIIAFLLIYYLIDKDHTSQLPYIVMLLCPLAAFFTALLFNYLIFKKEIRDAKKN